MIDMGSVKLVEWTSYIDEDCLGHFVVFVPGKKGPLNPESVRCYTCGRDWDVSRKVIKVVKKRLNAPL